MIEWFIRGGDSELEGKALEEKLQKIESLFKEEPNKQTNPNKIFRVEIEWKDRGVVQKIVYEEKGDPLEYIDEYLAEVLKEYHQTTGEDPRSKFPHLSFAVGYKKAQ